MSTQAFQSKSEFSQQQTWYSGSVTSQEIVTSSQAQKNISDVKYTEEYEQSKGKGSFPAMITPGYQAAKNANALASSVSVTFSVSFHQSYSSRPLFMSFVSFLCSWNIKKDTRKESQSTQRLSIPPRCSWPKNKDK